MKENEVNPAFKSVLRPVYNPLRNIAAWIHFNVRIRAIRKNTHNAKAIFLIGSPTHGNLGDHAISLAELDFLKDYFPDTPIIELFGLHFGVNTESMVQLVKKEDILLVTGGGFLGNLWLSGEMMVRNVIKLFPDNKIIILPQTIFFTKDETGERELAETLRIYQAHHDLHLFVRETASQEFTESNVLGGHFRDCSLVPDIVMYLNRSHSSFRREGILFCLRSDKESVLHDDDHKTLSKYASEASPTVTTTDTVLKRRINKHQRIKLLTEKLNEFEKSKLVITDRLHGMLFAAITGTPCIALGNSSGKVKGVYQWLEHVDYVQYIDNLDQVPAHISRLMNLESCKYDNSQQRSHFKKIAQTIAGL